MIVRLSNPRPIQIAMIGAEIESVNPSGSPMDDGIRQPPSRHVVTTGNEQRVTDIRANVGSEHQGGRVIVVFDPKRCRQ